MHYIPIQIDLSDLHDALIFFRGDGNGDGAHESLARKIAIAGRQWSKTYWRKEDLAAYFFRCVDVSNSAGHAYDRCFLFYLIDRLSLEYVRLMSTDRESMSYNDGL